MSAATGIRKKSVPASDGDYRQLRKRFKRQKPPGGSPQQYLLMSDRAEW
jgi:hypothetical protein